MSSEPKKLQKLRTFRGDLEAVRGATSEPVTPPPVSKEPRSSLPPVLNAHKSPLITPPIQKEPPVIAPVMAPAIKAPVIPPSTPTPTSTLKDDIKLMLGETKATPRPTPPPASAIPDKIIKEVPTRAPTLSAEHLNVMDGNGEEFGGTVITNQKRGRFRLLPSMWEAVKLWISDAERALEKRAEKKRLAIPTVRTVEERKDVIKKAASVGALAPRDDYAKLAKKLPPKTKIEPAKPQATVIIADKKATPAPSWSHFDEPIVKPVIDSAPIPPAKPIEPPLVKIIEVPKPQPTPQPAPIPMPPVAVAEPPKIAVSQPVKPPEPEIPQRPLEETVVNTLPSKRGVNVEPVKLSIGRANTQPVPPVTMPRTTPRPRRNFRWLFYVGVATTAVVAIWAGASLVSWLLGEGAVNAPVAVNQTPLIENNWIHADSTTRASLPRSRTEWYANVRDSARSGVVMVAPVISIGGAEKAASPDEVLATLSWGVDPALTRSIENIVFLMADQKPAIALEVSAFDSAFGGLLLSENRLSTELFPLFGEVVTATYKVGAGTVPPEFVDDLASNHDIRILRDEMENERLVYGFVDQNTVIIAPDKETFLRIIERLR